MPQSPAATVRIGSHLEPGADEIFDELGTSPSAGVSTFPKVVIREHGVSSDAKLGNGVHTRIDKTSPKSRQKSLASGNSNLNHAGLAKKDEFYTLLSDIEAELPYYRGAFKGKVVFCNCDDPFESNFFKFFIQHFNDYKLEKLVATCYATSSFAGQCFPIEEVMSPHPTECTNSYKAVITYVEDSYNLDSLSKSHLKRLFSLPGNSIEALGGDGDFRSPECLALLDGADIVVTNPPFSLFRDFINVLVARNKKFLIIGNINAATYKEVFPLIRDNAVWLGASIHSGDRKFYVPDSYPLNAASCGVDDDGRRFIRVKGVRWFTNLDMEQRHQGIQLVKKFNPAEYPRFDNYNAINVSRTADIPLDYHGIMGVPITFLDKYDPNQFEILMLANGNVRANSSKEILETVGYKKHENDKGGVGVIGGKRSYARILIRNKHPKAS